MGVLLNGLREWMSDRGFNAIDDLRGRLALSRRNADPAAFMHAHYYEIVTRGQVLA